MAFLSTYGFDALRDVWAEVVGVPGAGGWSGGI